MSSTEFMCLDHGNVIYARARQILSWQYIFINQPRQNIYHSISGWTNQLKTMKHCLGCGRSRQFISANKYVSGWVRLHNILLESIGWARIWDTLLCNFIHMLLRNYEASKFQGKTLSLEPHCTLGI